MFRWLAQMLLSFTVVTGLSACGADRGPQQPSAEMPPPLESVQTFTGQTDEAGTVTFTDVNYTVQVRDVASEDPLVGMQVTLVASAGGAEVIVSDPERRFIPRVFSLGGRLTAARTSGGEGEAMLERVYLAPRDGLDYLGNQLIRGYSFAAFFSEALLENLYRRDTECLEPHPTLGEAIHILEERATAFYLFGSVEEIVVAAVGFSGDTLAAGAAMKVLLVTDIVNLGLGSDLVHDALSNGYLLSDLVAFCESKDTLLGGFFGGHAFIRTFYIQPIGPPSGAPLPPRRSAIHVITTDDATGSAIPAQVSVAGASPRFDIAGPDGRTNFDDLPAGKHTLLVGSPGYQSLQYEVDLDGGASETLIVGLRHPSATRPGSFSLDPPALHCDEGQPGVRLAWSVSSLASSYALYRDGAPYFSTVSGTAFDGNADFREGQNYTYTVVARNASGTTQSSNSVTASVPSGICATPPSPVEAPLVTGISPNPVSGSNQRQWLTLDGRFFQRGASVTLTASNGTYPIPSNRTSYDSPSEISVFVNVTTESGDWQVRVTNPDGRTSNSFAFSVGGGLPSAGATVIAGAQYHSVALRGDGTVWSWGRNQVGQLGDGSLIDRSLPVRVSGLSDVLTIATGENHSLAVRRDGSAWAWGFNIFGALGDGSTEDRSEPVQVVGLSGVRAVAAGSLHSLALLDDGSVWAWGSNGVGQLGDSSWARTSTPVQVDGLSDVRAVAAGAHYSVALRADGTVWTWGHNWYGQLGDGSTSNRGSPVQVVGLADVREVAAGLFHALALGRDGTVWAWGDNRSGYLGDGSTTNRSSPAQVVGLHGAQAVAASRTFSLALLDDATVWAWGTNYHHQLGDATSTSRSSPVRVVGLSNVVAVAAGEFHAMAVGHDSTLSTWGRNNYGQLGDGSDTSRSSPVEVVALRDVMKSW